MRGVIAIALVLFAAPVAAASEVREKEPAEDEKIVAEITEQAPAEPEIILAPIDMERRTAADESAVQEMPARGSFWWVVGAIVVAGIILAVVL